MTQCVENLAACINNGYQVEVISLFIKKPERLSKCIIPCTRPVSEIIMIMDLWGA